MDSPNRRRTGAVVVSLALTVACLAERPAAQESAVSVSRVRPTDPSIAALMRQALPHSPTLRRLVATVDASDGIVWVEAGQCPGRVAACLPNWMVSHDGNRFVRIVLDRKRLDSDRRLLASLGHELQHVAEVLDERSVTNGMKMSHFYRRYKPTEQTRFETEDAILVGIAVQTELKRMLPSSPQPLSE